MSIEDRLGKFDLSQFSNNSDSRAALHLLLSQFAENPNLQAINESIQSPETRPLDRDTTARLQLIRSSIMETLDSAREVITLSPVGPSGIDSLLTETNPLKVAHATGRNVDIVSDPTIQLAVEAYRRRKKKDDSDILLGAFQRCFRLQRYEGKAGTEYTPHFEMFGSFDSTTSITASRFSVDRISEIVGLYLRVIEKFIDPKDIEVSVGNVQIASTVLTDTAFDSSKQERQQRLNNFLEQNSVPIERHVYSASELSRMTSVLARLGFTWQARDLEILYTTLNEKLRLPVKTTIELNRLNGVGHYSGLVFSILVGGNTDIVDGGSVDWLSKLTSNRKEVSVVSGMGTELFAKLT